MSLPELASGDGWGLWCGCVGPTARAGVPMRSHPARSVQKILNFGLALSFSSIYR
jgi:hypothetical protein